MTETLRAGDLELRPATVADARFAADMITALRPDDPQDPAAYKHWWAHPSATTVVERFIGLLEGMPAAVAIQGHARWDLVDERFGRVFAELLPEHRTTARLDALLGLMEERSRTAGSAHFRAEAWEDDALRCGILRDRGYREQRRERFWELDLVANRERLEQMAAESRARMREQGIAVLTIDHDDDAEKWQRLWRMSDEAMRDIPRSTPYVETPFEDFMNWMNGPGIHHDRVWIARQGGELLGVSVLSYPERGVVSTDWTGMARAARGKGIARALKCETVMQAIALGVDRIRTDNDSQNSPILHINETMGYVRRPDMIMFTREA